MEEIKILKKLNSNLDEVLSFARDGILKSERFYGTKDAVEDELKKLAINFDERAQLSIEKTIPQWRNVPKTGFPIQESEAVKQLTPVIVLIKELLSKLETSPGEQVSTKDEFVVAKGEQYVGRQYLRSLFSQAKKSIFIRDSYLRPEILDVLAEYIFDIPSLKLIFLISDNPKRLPIFRASLRAFCDQYKGDIQCKYTLKENKDHPRCLVIDDELLFDATHSFDQWGYNTVTIHQMTSEESKQKLLSILQSEFKTASEIFSKL